MTQFTTPMLLWSHYRYTLEDEGISAHLKHTDRTKPRVKLCAVVWRMFLLHENTRTVRFSNNAAPMLFASLRGRRTHTPIRSKAVGHPVLVCSGGANIHVPVHHPYTHTCTVGEQGGERTPDKNKTRKRTAKQQATPAGREREREMLTTPFYRLRMGAAWGWFHPVDMNSSPWSHTLLWDVGWFMCMCLFVLG